jgi:hypothetical protein
MEYKEQLEESKKRQIEYVKKCKHYHKEYNVVEQIGNVQHIINGVQGLDYFIYKDEIYVDIRDIEL